MPTYTLAETWRQVPCRLGTSRDSRRTWKRLYGDPGKWWVLHYCNRKLCYEPRHLYLGTAADNGRDHAASFTPSTEVHATYVVDREPGTGLNPAELHLTRKAVGGNGSVISAGIYASRQKRGLTVLPRCGHCDRGIRRGFRWRELNGVKYHPRCPLPPPHITALVPLVGPD